MKIWKEVIKEFYIEDIKNHRISFFIILFSFLYANIDNRYLFAFVLLLKYVLLILSIVFSLRLAIIFIYSAFKKEEFPVKIPKQL